MEDNGEITNTVLSCAVRDGFVFTSISAPHNVYDTIVIRNPNDVKCNSPLLLSSEHNLEEHIAFVNESRLSKAMIIGESIDFLPRCPSLQHLVIRPCGNIGDDFDYSPLYHMPQIKSLRADTCYGPMEKYKTTIDCACICGLECLSVVGNGYIRYNQVPTLKSLFISCCDEKDLRNSFCSPYIDTITIVSSKLQTLEGLQKLDRLQCAYFYHNYRLSDISILQSSQTTLKSLCIGNCPKVSDLSILSSFSELEYLMLEGNGSIENLDFLQGMTKLKMLNLGVNVISGDLTPCKEINRVWIQRDRRHYNLKNTDLPKGERVYGNENIPPWRRGVTL